MLEDTTDPTLASVSPSTATEPSGSAGTAGSRAAFATLKPLEAHHLVALEERGLDAELLVKHGVGASDKLPGDCIGIPFIDGGVQVAMKYRTLTGSKRFSQDKGGKQILWNVDCLRDETLATEPLIITEGELDALSALQAGFPRSVSVPGGAPSTSVAGEGPKYAFLEEAAPLLKDCREIILAVDSDGPGANLLHDLSLRLGKHRCKWLKYPQGCKDLNDALRLYGVRGVQETIRRAQWLRVDGVYRLSELPPVDMPKAYDIGIQGLWEHYRMRRGDFAVVTGMPGHGKSSFVNEICCKMAEREGWTTVFASFEQNPQVDHRRALRSYHSQKLEKTMSEDEKQAADDWIDRHFAFIVPSEDDDATLDWVLDRCAASVIRYGANIVVIDPWNELDHARDMTMSLTEYVGAAIKQFRKFARKYRVHMIVVAHPAKMARTKDGKYPFPTLYDISDSAHWSNKADVGVVVHRESMMSSNETAIRIVKSRYHNVIGKPGEITGVWDEHRTRYTITEKTEGSMPADPPRHRFAVVGDA
jgi:twinkle protein